MTPTVLGSIVSLWRYPVKSMLGEEAECGRSHQTRVARRSRLRARGQRRWQGCKRQEPAEVASTVRLPRRAG